ncbi:hypothetical protein L3Q82_025435 [Scortum barcoo]|uniref:Uncharacterized protein n=1 Tax=Scortum barcoo TaxID=214431 RepID=A0ACB8WMY4_9TELE|nr:hypothetical protein L3Q82_025435 [Scortum barcoo]
MTAGLCMDPTPSQRFADDITHECADNNLLLNTNKTKELIVDFRKVKRETHDPIHINGMAVERVSSFKFLGIHISENLSWTANTSSLIKKAHQRLFFLRTLKKNHLSTAILGNFYRCAIESILTNCITVWYGNCSVITDRKALQRVVKTAQRITKTPLPAIEGRPEEAMSTNGHVAFLRTPLILDILFFSYCPPGSVTGASRLKPAVGRKDKQKTQSSSHFIASHLVKTELRRDFGLHRTTPSLTTRSTALPSPLSLLYVAVCSPQKDGNPHH